MKTKNSNSSPKSKTKQNKDLTNRRAILERVCYIHELIQAGNYPTSRQIAQHLQVAMRTVHRDIAAMRNISDLPIAYDARKHGFYYTEPVKWVPALPHLSQQELFALVVAKKAIEQYSGTPFAAPVQAAYRKLSWRMEDRALARLESFHGAFSFRPYAPEHADAAVLALVTEALKDQHLLQFYYRNAGAQSTIPRLIEPYHVTCCDNRWYVIGYDRVRKGYRTFALGRMSQPAMRPEAFTKREDFDPAKYLRGSMTVMNGTGDYAVVIELDAWATDVASGRKWHASQEMTPLPGGSRVSFRLNNLEEIQRWVLSWGTHATVVAPEALRERIGEVGRQLAERYRGNEENGQN